MKKRERAIELMTWIVQAQANITKWEAELDSLLDSGQPKRERKPRVAVEAKERGGKRSETPAPAPAPANNGHGKRGGLTDSLLKALPKMHGEFTSNELIEAAGVPEERRNSAFAAISRLAALGADFKKSTTPGRFQRVS